LCVNRRREYSFKERGDGFSGEISRGRSHVSLFTLIADVLKPKGFAGLFGAAPSVALASLGLTIASHGKLYAAIEARSMVAGAAAFLLYALSCLYFIGMRHFKAAPATVALLSIWVVGAFGLWAAFLR
jgi:hypothetical protein